MTTCLANTSPQFFLNLQKLQGEPVLKQWIHKAFLTGRTLQQNQTIHHLFLSIGGQITSIPCVWPLGLDSRGELRCLQDYLADMDQSVHLVSETGHRRFISGRLRRKLVVPGEKQVTVVVQSPHFI